MSNFILNWKNKLPVSRSYLWTEMQKLQKRLQGDTAETKEQVMNLGTHIDECVSEFKLELQGSIAQLSEYVNQLQTGQKDSIRELQGGIEQEIRQLEGVMDRALMEWKEGAGGDQEEILKKIFAELRAHRVRSVENQLYLNLTERNALVGSFKAIMDDPEQFEPMYRKLVAGLDFKSRETVNRILVRMRKLLDGNTKTMDLFTREEQQEFLNMKDKFQSQILQISENLFAYNGYLLPVNQFDSSVFYSRYGMHLLRNIQTVQNKDIIDVGGYIGDTALLFSPLTNRNVYVFEASPDNCAIIEQTIQLNQLENIKLEHMALSDHAGVVTFNLGERSSCNSLVERAGYTYPEHIQVQATTLDEYVQEHHLDVGLLKVDIEGGEQLFLQGALETIRKFHPILLFSIYHSGEDFFKIKAIIDDMDLDYQFQIFKPINNAVVIETLLIGERRRLLKTYYNRGD